MLCHKDRLMDRSGVYQSRVGNVTLQIGGHRQNDSFNTI